MNSRTIRDLQVEVFRNSVDHNTLRRLLDFLNRVESQWRGQIEEIRTRHSDGRPLEYEGIKYFRVTSIRRGRAVIFAGSMQKRELEQTRVPVIRFRSRNRYLKRIQKEWRFPFSRPRKEDWECVVVNSHTIGSMLNLMNLEISSYLSNLS